MTEPLPDPSPRLNAAVTKIAQRMRGLGFVNPAIRVEAVGFRAWQGHWVGAMVTPWFINLMLLPRDPQAWTAVAQGATTRHLFPAGSFDFIGAHDDTFGPYQMCSLFSPALDFTDHETAALVAQLALQALFDPAHAPADAELPTEVAAASGAAREVAMTKRDFLRGRFMRSAADG